MAEASKGLVGWFLLAACGGAPQEAAVSHVPVEPPEVAAWVRQVGFHLGPARACVEQHPDPGATIVGLRELRTGETSILMRSNAKGVVACVHDGHDVVYQARVDVPEEELAALPFVTLARGPEPRGGACRRVIRLHWGSLFIGWAVEPSCGPKEVGDGSD